MARAKADKLPKASAARSRAVMNNSRSNHDRDSVANTNVMQEKAPITSVNTIATRMKEAREAKGWTQEELRVAAGVKSQGTIGNIESGARQRPRELLAIAAALEVRPEWLQDGELPVRSARSVNSAPAPASGVAHSPSLKSFETVPTHTWEETMKRDQEGVLENEFFALAPDDAMAPRAPAGSRWFFIRDDKPRFGDGVIVRDQHGALYLREYRQGNAPGEWRAVAAREAYRSFSSVTDRVQLVAVLRIPMTGWADL